MQDVYCYTDEDLDKAYKELEEKGIAREQLGLQRYKGLGEMNPEQLWETTMNPETRTLVQVKLEDMTEAESQIEILMGSDSARRRDWLENHVSFTLEEE